MGTEPEAVCGGDKPAMTRRRGKTRVGRRAPESAAPPRLRPISAKIGLALSREIDAYAADRGVTRSRAAAQYLDIASETLREREGIPGGRADELLGVLEAMEVMLDILGPPTLGILRLLAHWASLGGGVKVNEDELLAELRAVGADEWEQAIAEAARPVSEPPRQPAELSDVRD
jgi:hypothetical protein